MHGHPRVCFKGASEDFSWIISRGLRLEDTGRANLHSDLPTYYLVHLEHVRNIAQVGNITVVRTNHSLQYDVIVVLKRVSKILIVGQSTHSGRYYY